MLAIAEQDVQIIAPPWALVTLDRAGKIVPSAYAKAAKRAGPDIITWTLERSGPLGKPASLPGVAGGGYYDREVAWPFYSYSFAASRG